MTNPNLIITDESEEHRIGYLKDEQGNYLLFQEWLGVITMSSCLKLRETATFIAQQSYKTSAQIVVTGKDAPAPSSACRHILLESGQIIQDRSVGCAFILEQKGFVAATIRGILSGMSAAGAFKFELQVFQQLQPGTQWISEKLGWSPSYLSDLSLRSRSRVA